MCARHDVPDESAASAASAAASESANGHAFYESLVRDHGRTLYGVAMRLTRDAGAAEDIVQDVFVEAWKGISKLRDRANARAWLFGILRHRYARWVRSERRQPAPRVDAVDVAELITDPGPDAMRLLADKERVGRAMAAMDVRFREPLLLVFAEGLTSDDAATILDIPRNTVLSRMHRGREFLRGYLRRLDEQST